MESKPNPDPVTIPDAPIPGKADAPHPPWVLAYAHVDGKADYVLIADLHVVAEVCKCLR